MWGHLGSSDKAVPPFPDREASTEAHWEVTLTPLPTSTAEPPDLGVMEAKGGT